MLIEASVAINQEITPKTLIHTLSGGQQIVLAVYLALHSLAEKIIFVEIFSSLDSDRRALVQSLFDKEPAGRVTVLEGEKSV